ncbi:MAG: integrase core domain-containing protein, partial [Puniceicoccales bacterium]|nr:integrase core domain-containing protein [Puniceicoccales bacterium]
MQHCLTEFRPWVNGLIERMNRSIKDATVKIYFYETLNDLKRHLALWLLAYNHQKKL